MRIEDVEQRIEVMLIRAASVPQDQRALGGLIGRTLAIDQ
jgi:hypothetical protein